MIYNIHHPPQIHASYYKPASQTNKSIRKIKPVMIMIVFRVFPVDDIVSSQSQPEALINKYD